MGGFFCLQIGNLKKIRKNWMPIFHYKQPVFLNSRSQFEVDKIEMYCCRFLNLYNNTGDILFNIGSRFLVHLTHPHFLKCIFRLWN